jgi:hypothetical protein
MGMTASSAEHARKPVVAFGPVMPGWGSWEWVGADLVSELAQYFRTTTFAGSGFPDADVVVVVKHAPPREWVEQVARRAAVVYCPVDFYGSAAEIDADAVIMRRCARVVVHCERLRRYFEPYARVQYLDHHVKFISPLPEGHRQDGYVLWVGVRTNLPPLVEWVNAHPLPGELRVLTNPEQPGVIPPAAAFGFRQAEGVRIEEWSPELHRERAAGARAALDVKGNDFRSRHKPPAKAIDFLASGVPLALQPDSSPAEHLARLGFEAAEPEDAGCWLSRAYWEETRRFGAALRELLSIQRVGRRWKRLLDAVLAERRPS